MKKLTSTLFILMLCHAGSAQIKPYFVFDAGTSTKLTPVVAMFGGIENRTENSDLKPFAELGLRTHIDNKNIAYGSLNAGIEYKFIGFSSGIAYGGCKSEDDVYIKPDGTEVILLTDVKRGSFISPVFTLRGTFIKIYDTPVFAHAIYCQKVLFAGIGVKCIIGE